MLLPLSRIEVEAKEFEEEEGIMTVKQCTLKVGQKKMKALNLIPEVRRLQM